MKTRNGRTTTRVTKCIRCSGSLEPGFIMELTVGPGKRWVEGDREISFLGRVKLGARKPMPVVTYRCGKCGYLESYARDGAE